MPHTRYGAMDNVTVPSAPGDVGWAAGLPLDGRNQPGQLDARLSPAEIDAQRKLVEASWTPAQIDARRKLVEAEAEAKLTPTEILAQIEAKRKLVQEERLLRLARQYDFGEWVIARHRKVK
jgi:hypothetical protein